MPSKIEWTHWPGFRGETLNPIVGCSETSVGCDHCYAVRTAHRLAGNPNRAVQAAYRGLTHKTAYGDLEWTGTVRFRPEELEKLERWRKPRCIFWCSMSDMFHPRVGVEWFHRILLIMIAHSEHRHIVLTKRPVRMFDAINFFIGSFCGGHEAVWRRMTKHIAWGVTAETQELLDERVPWLVRVPAARRFVSIEPMLGPVDLTRVTAHLATWFPRRLAGMPPPDKCGPDVLCGTVLREDAGPFSPCRCGNRALDWVIVGGETGPGARPMDPDWARQVRDDCGEAGVPFFFKQWGEWLQWDYDPWDPGDDAQRVFTGPGEWPRTVYRVGRKFAGCELDGQEHKEFPCEG